MTEETPQGMPESMSIPEAGWHFLGLSRGGSYDAADRGEIPYVRIGRLKRVPVRAMERMLEAASNTQNGALDRTTDPST
jgi:hypothetical protein